MPQATILDVPMGHWPPTTTLVLLDEPLRQFSPEDGTLLAEHTHIAVCCKASDPQESYVFPSTEEGGFVDTTMTPMRRRPFGTVPDVLAALGYTVAP